MRNPSSPAEGGEESGWSIDPTRKVHDPQFLREVFREGVTVI